MPHLADDLRRLSGLAGTAAFGVAATFAAYLIGIVSIGAFAHALFVFGNAFQRRIERLSSYSGPNYILDLQNSVMDILGARLREGALWKRIVEHLSDELVEAYFRLPRAIQTLDANHMRLGTFNAMYLTGLPVLEEPNEGCRIFVAGSDGVTEQSQDETARLAKMREILSEKAPTYPDLRRLLLSRLDAVSLAARVKEDLRLLPARLVSQAPPVYDRWDRLQAEGEFRAAIIPPLLSILTVLAIRGELSWWLTPLLAVPLVAILLQAVRRQLDAQVQLVQAVEIGIVDTPFLLSLAPENVPLREEQDVYDDVIIQLSQLSVESGRGADAHEHT